MSIDALKGNNQPKTIGIPRDNKQNFRYDAFTLKSLGVFMSNAFLPFARPSISEAAIAEVNDSLRKGWLATGPKVQLFKQNLIDYFGGNVLVLPLTSATAGLHLVMQGLNLQPGDEVITTPLTFVATLNAIALSGAKPVLVDIDPHTLNIDLNLLEKAITPKTKVLMPVHFAGLPCDMDDIYEIAKRHQLRVVEDAAHAIGAEYKGKKIGSFGDIQIFSFHPTKNLTTGEGGCVVTRDEKLMKYLEAASFHGIDRSIFNRFSKEGSHEYDVIFPGYKYNMSDIQGALGIHQLKELPEFLIRRAQIANRYLSEFGNWDEWNCPVMPNYSHKHAWHIFTPQINIESANMNRSEFMSAMKAENIGIGLHFNAVHLYHYFQKTYGWKRGDFKIAESIGDRIMSLPLFPAMTDADQEYVIQSMKKIFGRK